jgi:hypothetical protein
LELAGSVEKKQINKAWRVNSHIDRPPRLGCAASASIQQINHHALDYDDAYHEAKRIILRLFGETEDFLVREMMNDNVKDEDGE